MKILILGGNRYFGKRLAQHLSGEHEVTLLNRQTLDDGLGSSVRRIKSDRNELASAIHESFDVVYDQICYEAAQARAAIKIFSGRIGRYVLTSSQSVYNAGASIDESVFDPTIYKFLSDSKDYAEAKRQCEAVFFQNADFPVTAIRFPIVCGPDDYTKRLQWHIDRVRDGKPMYFPNLQARLSLIHSEDAARLLTGIHTPGSFNVCANEPIALAKLVEVIEHKVGRKAVFATQAEAENHSPFGIDADWFMSTKKLNSIGLQAKPILDWLPNLI